MNRGGEVGTLPGVPTFPPKRRAKYGAEPTYRVDPDIGRIRFDSKREAIRWDALQLAKKAGEVVRIVRQVPFPIGPRRTYRLDFMVFWKDGTTTYEDVKGFRTDEYKAKKRLVEELYQLEITELK